MNPLTALSLALAGWIAVMGINLPQFSLAVAAVALAVATAKTRTLGVVAAVAALTVPAGLSMTLVHAPYGAQRIAPLITLDGLAVAGELTLRFMALMACFIGAMAFVRIPELVKALQVAPGGNRVAYIVGSALQLFPQGTRTVAVVRDANRLRGRRLSVRNVVPHLVLPLLAHLLSNGASRGFALETAGYDLPGSRTVLRPARDSSLQRAVRWLAPAIAVAVVVWI
ncbi:ABC transporter permease [Corynebacterium sp.]|uniref:ABC transporter permease n=1 Tax=Corynebacterium sp. TaxID=1720 RepID=UPI002A9165DB|nr:ABC transporter permease [Corynebacterium sp.]MDY5785953.1 ABC transporter permease [Corynebacterium sp.]